MLELNLGQHATFIVASYAMTVIVVIGLAVWIARDYAAQRRILHDLESRGVKRRSQRGQDNA